MSYDVYWVKNRAEKITDFEHPTPYPTMRLEVIRRFKPERKDSYPNSVLKGFA